MRRMREAASFWSLPRGRVGEELVLGLEDEEGMDWSRLALAVDRGRRRRRLAETGGGAAAHLGGQEEEGLIC
jgi:hypothetical protein